ncbi:TetR/AcrR family transcriptional regulator [Brooklawnia sp.]|uniref:TetR/AcrR family transcriptional regulator n=1 Tax=Brooklawnia sp. TaxID=2699740 RepID=UPI00311F9534
MMTSKQTPASGRTGRAPTFTEAARREQIIGLTIDLIAERGIARTTLALIAEAAGVTKPAVLYFFGTKDAVIKAACAHALGSAVEAIAQAVMAAPTPTAAVAAYVRSTVQFTIEHPSQIKVMTEMLTSDQDLVTQSAEAIGEEPAPQWQALAGLIEQAQRGGELSPADPRTAAIGLIGATNAIVGEWFSDPSFDLRAATDEVLRLFFRATTADHPAET